MSSAFISYSVEDENLAKNLYSAISLAGIDTFLASISINPGSNWTDEIFKKLEKSEWVFFIASKNSISSSAVQQELGASLIQKKTIIPILIDIKPEDLPGWVSNHQAIDVKGSPELLNSVINKIAKQIKVDEFWAKIIVAAIIIGLSVLLLKK